MCALLLFMAQQATAQLYDTTHNDFKRTSGMPWWAVKTNLLYDATTTFNLGTEVRLAKKATFDLSFNYNPWTFSDNKKFKHLLIQPEFRYWLCEAFYGHFLGAHFLYSHYNVGGVHLPFGFFPALRDRRYQGDLYGVGIDWGYHWIWSSRWSMEFSVGVGYVYTDYKKYRCEHCGDELGREKKSYFTPTKVAVSLIYMIK
ncbi:MAG: DUF3575 domain-containing protein [Prevotellaceae bacterium]|nr:DUF3575 domain-containing protein [Prevotellaceae bacterium]